MKAGEQTIGIFDRLARALGMNGSRSTAASATLLEYLRSGYAPAYLGRTIINIPEVRTAVNSIAERVAAVPYQHVRVQADGAYQAIQGSVNNALSIRPNPYNTPQSFITHLITRLLLYNNVYVMPEWDDRGELKWLWPLPFSSHEYTTDQKGDIKIRFSGASGIHEFYWQDIIHLQRFPWGKGGYSTQATDNYTTILNAIELQAVTDSANSNKLSILLQPLKELKSKTGKEELAKFKEDYLTVENTTGYGVLPNDYKITEVQPKNVPLNVQMLQTIVAALYSYFGTSTDIVNLKASEEAFIQYVDGTIKPIIYQLQEEFTYKLCTPTEIARGQRIQANLIDMEVATIRDKTLFLKELKFAGMISGNEGRLLVGLPRGPKELDEYQVSKNFEKLQPGNYVVEGGEDAGKGTDEATEGQAGPESQQ